MTANTAPVEFSWDDFSSADTSDMTVIVNGKPTDWVWTFAGPGHPQAVEHSNRISRERLHRDKQVEQQRLNGKKVKLPDETPEEIRARNIDYVVDRLLGWSPIRIDGADYPFTAERAREFLSSPKRGQFLLQALEFINDDNSFTQRSATS